MSLFNDVQTLSVAYSAGVDRNRANDAVQAANFARARANVLARSADDLRQDLILAQIEISDLEEQVIDAKSELEAERVRTSALMGMLINLKQPGMKRDHFTLTLQSALRTLRNQ